MRFLSWLRRVSKLRKYYVLRYHGTNTRHYGVRWRDKKDTTAFCDYANSVYPIPSYVSFVWE